MKTIKVLNLVSEEKNLRELLIGTCFCVGDRESMVFRTRKGDFIELSFSSPQKNFVLSPSPGIAALGNKYFDEVVLVKTAWTDRSVELQIFTRVFDFVLVFSTDDTEMIWVRKFNEDDQDV